MTDDDADEDLKLPPLRAVWLAIPDEEPPQRGLAELMAAARVKADEMAKPSPWQRIVALLRRPPVLALASLMILVGGAVLIGKRDAHRDAALATSEPARAPHEGAEVAGSAAPANDTTAAPVTLESEPAPEVPAIIEEDALAERSKAAPPSEPARKRPARRSTRDTSRARLEREPEAMAEALGKVPARRSAVEEDLRARPQGAATGRDEGGADVALGGATLRSDRGGAAAAPTDVARARSAAARGDCERVRELMQRVAAEDPALHRKTVAGDAAIKKCLE